ncbi:VPLPA-CTERM protein sorting domain-containing protein [Poseidonocella pacifica]|uniref:VPLPA-CTERM protein sorting domain-containing protein n=1 Tax=Poseidonocella pacifica TaxID=871651 RepID=A0A1I0YVI1_9RHOB|nr:VPLPA-CTERM sorting domain-containing protein [Poseidonocella pacifica]SFB17395.1 VPLPA-CTERM protein sorting domain-containing protein [Poseidonocella pacifica]
MFLRSTFIGAALALLTALPAAATVVPVNGGWVRFNFGDVGSSFSGEPFTFTLAQSGKLKVTDAFLDGDRFEIFNFGTSLGFTSVPDYDEVDVGRDFDAAFAEPRWSSGTWALGAGSYSITGLVTLSPYEHGAAALMVSTVPVPAALPLLVAALGGLGFTARRCKAA